MSRAPFVLYGACVNTLSESASSKNSCEVNSCIAPAEFLARILKWMCTARPRYQPGYTVVNRTRPDASVTWKPRRKSCPFELPFIGSLTSE